MPRGGRRSGAGRPPGRKHDDLKRWEVGADCEKLWREAVQANIEMARDNATRNVRAEWKKAQKDGNGMPVVFTEHALTERNQTTTIPHKKDTGT